MIDPAWQRPLQSSIDRAFYSLEAKHESLSLLVGKRFGCILTYENIDEIKSGGVNAINSIRNMDDFAGYELTDIVHCSIPGDNGDDRNLIEECTKPGKR
jgi:hypothetical protein